MKPLAGRAGMALFFVLASATAVAGQPPGKPVPAVQLSGEECGVWARELSFARSVAEHDAVAFASHVEADAAFGASGPEPTRGRDEITRRWGAIIDGKRVRLDWYPTRTTIGGVGDIAWSSGPSLFEDPDPKAEHRYRIGDFHSVWHRGADGQWRVLFDDGSEPRPVSEAEAVAFREGRRTICPQA